MIKIDEINPDTWEKILYANSPDDKETIEFLQEHEEDILNILIEDAEGKSLDEKRREYVIGLLHNPSDKEEVIKKILEIRTDNNYSILQFGKKLPGSSYMVYEFGDKVIKLGKYYRVLKDPNILQPELQMSYGQYDEWMTVYERVPEIFTENDKDIAQEMYNRIRDNGILWFDALGQNVGRTPNRRDENDDGLRIIDAQYMEYERDVLMAINPEKNEIYKSMGIAMYNRAIQDYILDHGYMGHERKYQEMKGNRRKATKQETEVVAKKSSMNVLQGIREFFSKFTHGKERD